MIRFPAEFEKHEGTIMIWPTRPGSWGTDPRPSQNAFLNVMKSILKEEDLWLLVDPKVSSEEVSRIEEIINSKRLHIFRIKSDDAWARDTGPTYVIKNGKRIGIDWGFNAWGGDYDGLYKDYENDRLLASKFLELKGDERIDRTGFILEGGSVHSDGEGTLMVTESCLLSPGRNPSMSKEEIEKYLCDALGAKKVLWLPCGIYNDETNEHVDNVAAFVAPGEIVLAWTDDKDDPQYEMSLKDLNYLQGQTDAKGRKLNIHKLPIPAVPIVITEKDFEGYSFEDGEDEREVGERLAASYANFYFTNGSVLVPSFGGANEESDKQAYDILCDLCKDREVVMIPANEILMGGGNSHCITQQIPFI